MRSDDNVAIVRLHVKSPAVSVSRICTPGAVRGYGERIFRRSAFDGNVTVSREIDRPTFTIESVRRDVDIVPYVDVAAGRENVNVVRAVPISQKRGLPVDPNVSTRFVQNAVVQRRKPNVAGHIHCPAVGVNSKVEVLLTAGRDVATQDHISGRVERYLATQSAARIYGSVQIDTAVADRAGASGAVGVLQAGECVARATAACFECGVTLRALTAPLPDGEGVSCTGHQRAAENLDVPTGKAELTLARDGQRTRSKVEHGLVRYDDKRADDTGIG